MQEALIFSTISKVTNHHEEGHSRKLQALSYAFSVFKVAGFGGMGMEFREVFTPYL